MVDANVLKARLSKLDEYVGILEGLQRYTQQEFLLQCFQVEQRVTGPATFKVGNLRFDTLSRALARKLGEQVPVPEPHTS